MGARGLRLVALVLGLAGAAGAHDEFTVTGRFLYEDKAWDWSGWTGAWQELPIRGADVLVLDAEHERVLGRGLTDAQGEFAVACHGHGVADLLVRVEASNRFRKLAGVTGPRLVVVDDAGARWSGESPVFPAHDPSLDLDAGTTTVQAVLVAGSQGNPFNVFDQAVAGWEHLEAQAGAAPNGPLRLQWPSFSGSWAWRRTAHIADDDGYDDAVILHELGHLVHNAWSDSDSPGGMHWFGDSDQDPRLSFAEGYATAFAGAVLSGLGRPPLYVDCEGPAAVGGVQLRLDLETLAPYALSAEGSADEVAVACALHDLLDDEGAADAAAGVDDDPMGAALLVGGQPLAQAWWQVFTGPVRHARRGTLNSAWDGWSAVHGDAAWDELRAIFDAHGMRFWNDAFEPDGTPELATPLAVGPDFSPEHTLYFALDEPAENGTGDEDWFAVSLLAAQVVRIETRYPGGATDARTQADTYLALFDPQGKRVAGDEDGGTGRNARLDAFVVDATGTWRFKVHSRDGLHRYGRYEVRVSLLPSN